jgi:hypothetical protein
MDDYDEQKAKDRLQRHHAGHASAHRRAPAVPRRRGATEGQAMRYEAALRPPVAPHPSDEARREITAAMIGLIGLFLVVVAISEKLFC